MTDLRARLTAALADRYAIERELGRGASITGAPLPPTATLLEALNAGGPAGLLGLH